MNQALVGTKTVASVEELQNLLDKLAPKVCCYFARWAHEVSGFVQERDKALPSPEGQMLTSQFEVRWKQNSHKGYEVLLLHCDTSVTELGFSPVGDGWLVSKPLAAHFYDEKDQRFPQGFHSTAKVKVQQRYFQDAATATVRFVALTLIPPPAK